LTEAVWSNQGEFVRFNPKDETIRIYVTNRGGQPEIQEQDEIWTQRIERGGLAGEAKNEAQGRSISAVESFDWDALDRQWVAKKVDVRTNGARDKEARDIQVKDVLAEIPPHLAPVLKDVKRAQEIMKWNASAEKWEFSEIILFDDAGHIVANIIQDPLYKKYAEGLKKRIIHIAEFGNNAEKFIGNPKSKSMYSYDPDSKAIGTKLLGKAVRVDDASSLIDISSNPEARRRLDKEGVSLYEISDHRQGKSWHAFFDWDHGDDPIARVEKRGEGNTLHLITYKRDLDPEAQKAYALFRRDNVVTREDTFEMAGGKIGRRITESVLNVGMMGEPLRKLLSELRLKNFGAQADILEQDMKEGEVVVYDVKPLYYAGGEIKSYTSVFGGYQELVKIDHERRRLSVNFFSFTEPWKQRAGVSFYYADEKILDLLALSVTSENTTGNSPRLPDGRPRENRQQTYVYEVALKQVFKEYRDLTDGAVREMQSGRYYFDDNVRESDRARILDARLAAALRQVETGDYDRVEKTIQENFQPFSVLVFHYGEYANAGPDAERYSEAYLVSLGIPTNTEAFLYDRKKSSEREEFISNKPSSKSKVFDLLMKENKGILIQSYQFGVAVHEDQDLYTDRIKGTDKNGKNIFVKYGYTGVGNEQTDPDIRRLGEKGNQGFVPDRIFRVFIDVNNPEVFPNARFEVADKTMTTLVDPRNIETLSGKSNSSEVLPWGGIRYKTQSGVSLQPIDFSKAEDELDRYEICKKEIQDPKKFRFWMVLASYVQEKYGDGFLKAILSDYPEVDPVTGYPVTALSPKYIAFMKYSEDGKQMPADLFHNGVPLGSDRFLFKHGTTDRLDYVRPGENPKYTSNWVQSLNHLKIESEGKLLNYKVDSRLYGGSLIGSSYYNDGMPESDTYLGGKGKPRLILVKYDKSGLPAVAYGNTDGRKEPWRTFEKGWWNDEQGNNYLIVFAHDSGRDPVLDFTDPENEWVVYKNGLFLAQYKEGKYLTQEYPTAVSLDDLASNSPLGKLAGLVGIESPRIKEARTAIAAARHYESESGGDPARVQFRGGFIPAEIPEGLNIPASTNMRWERFIADNLPFLIGIVALYSFAATVWWLLGRGYKRVYSVPLMGRVVSLFEWIANVLLLTVKGRRYNVNALEETPLLDVLSSRAAGAVINYRRSHEVIQTRSELETILRGQDLSDKEIQWLVENRLVLEDPALPESISESDLVTLRGPPARNPAGWNAVPLLAPLTPYVQDLLEKRFITEGEIVAIVARLAGKLTPGRLSQDLFRQKLLALIFDQAYWENDQYKPAVKTAMRRESKALADRLGAAMSDYELDELMIEVSDMRPPEYVAPLQNPIEGPAFGPRLWVMENRLEKEGMFGHHPVSLADYLIEYKILSQWIPFTAFETPYVRWLNRQVKTKLIAGESADGIQAFVKKQMEIWQIVLDDQFNVKFKTMRNIQDRGYYYESRKRREWKYLLIQEEFDDLFLFLMGEDEFGPLSRHGNLPEGFEEQRQAVENLALNGFTLPPDYGRALVRFPDLFADPESNQHMTLLLRDYFEEHGFASKKEFTAEDQTQFLGLLSSIRTGDTAAMTAALTALANLHSTGRDKENAEKFILGLVRRFEIQTVVDQTFKPFVLGVRKSQNIPGYYSEKGIWGVRWFIFFRMILDRRFWNGRGADADTARAARAKFFWLFTIGVWLALAIVIAQHTIVYGYQLPLPFMVALGGWELFLIPLTSLMFTVVAMIPVIYMTLLTYSGVSFVHKGLVRLFIRYKYRMVTAKTYADAVDILPAILGDPARGADFRRRFLKTVDQVHKERRLTFAEKDRFYDLVRMIESGADADRLQARIDSLKKLTSSATEESFLRMLNLGFRLDVQETPDSIRQLLSTTFLVTALNDNPWEFFDDLNKITEEPAGYAASVEFLKNIIAGNQPDAERAHRFRLAVAEQVQNKTISVETGDLLWNLADKKDIEPSVASLKAIADAAVQEFVEAQAKVLFSELQAANELETGIGQVAAGYPDQFDVLLDHLRRLVESGALAQEQWDEFKDLKTNRRMVLRKIKDASLGTAAGRAEAIQMVEEWVNMKKNSGLYNIISAMRAAGIVIDDYLEKFIPGSDPEAVLRRDQEKRRLLQPIHSFAQYNFDLQDYFRKKKGNVNLNIDEYVDSVHHEYMLEKSLNPALTVREFLTAAVREKKGEAQYFEELISNPRGEFVTQGGIAKPSEKKKFSKMLKVLEAAVEFNVILAQGYLADNINTATDPSKKNVVSHHEKSSIGLEKYSSWKGNARKMRGQLMMGMDIDHFHLMEEMWALAMVMQRFNVNSRFGIAPYHTIISNKSLSGVGGGMGASEEGWILGEQATLQEIAKVLFYGKGFERFSHMRRFRGVPQEHVAEDGDGAFNMAAQGVQTGSINYLATYKLLPGLYLGALVPLYKWSGDSSELAFSVNAFKFWFSPNVPWYEKLGTLRSLAFYLNKPLIERVTGLVIVIFYVLNWNPWFGLPLFSIFMSVMIMQGICYAGFMTFAESGRGYIGAFFAFGKAFFTYLFIFATGITPRYADASSRGYAKFADFIRTGGRAGVSKREKPIDLYLATQYGVKRGFLLSLVVLLSPFALGKFLIWVFQIMTVFMGWWMSSFLLNPARSETAREKALTLLRNWRDGIGYGGLYAAADTILSPVAGAVLLWRYGHRLYGGIPSFWKNPFAFLSFVIRVYIARPLTVLIVGSLYVVTFSLLRRFFDMHRLRFWALDEQVYKFTRQAMASMDAINKRRKDANLPLYDDPNSTWLSPIVTASQYSLKGFLRGRIPGLPSTVGLFAITSRAVAIRDKIDGIELAGAATPFNRPWLPTEPALPSSAAIGRNMKRDAGGDLNDPIRIAHAQQRMLKASFGAEGEIHLELQRQAEKYLNKLSARSGGQSSQPVWRNWIEWALNLAADGTPDGYRDPALSRWLVRRGTLGLLVPDSDEAPRSDREMFIYSEPQNPDRFGIGHSGFGGTQVREKINTAYFTFPLIAALYQLHKMASDSRAESLKISDEEIDRVARLLIRHEFQHLQEREQGNPHWENPIEVAEILSLLVKGGIIPPPRKAGDPVLDVKSLQSIYKKIWAATTRMITSYEAPPPLNDSEVHSITLAAVSSAFGVDLMKKLDDLETAAKVIVPDLSSVPAGLRHFTIFPIILDWPENFSFDVLTPAQIEKIQRTIDEVVAEHGPIRIRLKGLNLGPDGGLFVQGVPVESLKAPEKDSLYVLRQRLADLFPDIYRREFLAHITLLRPNSKRTLTPDEFRKLYAWVEGHRADDLGELVVDRMVLRKTETRFGIADTAPRKVEFSTTKTEASYSRSPLLPFLLSGFFAAIWYGMVLLLRWDVFSWNSALLGMVPFGFLAWTLFESGDVLYTKYKHQRSFLEAGRILDQTLDHMLGKNHPLHSIVRLDTREELGLFEQARFTGGLILIHPAFVDRPNVIRHELAHLLRDQRARSSNAFVRFYEATLGFFLREIRARWLERADVTLSPALLREAKSLGELQREARKPGLSLQTRRDVASLLKDMNPAMKIGVDEFVNKMKTDPRRVIPEFYAGLVRGNEVAGNLLGKSNLDGRSPAILSVYPESKDLAGILAEAEKYRREKRISDKRNIVLEILIPEGVEMPRKAEESRFLSEHNILFRSWENFRSASAEDLLDLPGNRKASSFHFAFASGAQRPDDIGAVLERLQGEFNGKLALFDYGMLMADGMIKMMSISDIMKLKLFEKAVADSQA